MQEKESGIKSLKYQKEKHACLEFYTQWNYN